MKTLGNILWVLFGGGFLALLWGFIAIICCCTIVGIPIGIQCFKFTSLVIWPFDKQIIFANSASGFLLNILWIFLFGWELAVVSCFVGFLWCVTIVGIPFGKQCIKFAQLALMPFGARVV